MATQVTMTITRPNAETAELGTSAEFDSAMDTAKASGDVLSTSTNIDGLVTTYTATFANEEARINFNDQEVVIAYHNQLEAYCAENSITVDFTKSEV